MKIFLFFFTYAKRTLFFYLDSNSNVALPESIFSSIISNSTLLPLLLIALNNQKNRQNSANEERVKHDHTTGII